MGLIETNTTRVLNVTATWSEIPNTIITWVTPLILAGLTIWIMWHGYKIIRGAGGQDHLLDVFFGSLRAFFIVSLCLVGGNYATNVVGMAHELRDNLTGLFLGAESNVYSQLDNILSASVDAFKEILDFGLEHLEIGLTGSDLSGLVFISMGGVMVGIIVVYVFVAALNMIMIDLSLTIIFAVGPLFVAALAFSATAQFFNTWLSAILKYIFTAVVIAAVVGFGLNIVQGFTSILSTQAPETIDYVGQGVGAAIAVGMLIFLTFKGAQIGADLGGGAALNVMSLAQAARWTVNPAGAALAQAAGSAAKVGAAGAGNLTGRTVAAASRTSIGKAMSSSRAMQSAMSGVNAMSNMSSGARTAMRHKSITRAMRSGYQSGSSARQGTGSVTK